MAITILISIGFFLLALATRMSQAGIAPKVLERFLFPAAPVAVPVKVSSRHGR